MNKNHIFSVDVIRGFSILLVLLHHFNIPYKLHLAWFDILCRNGNYGVTMFFVVSGFLITRNSLNRYGNISGIDFKDFYTRRAARILPCLFLLVALVSLLVWANFPVFVNHEPNGIHVSYAATVLAALTFCMNILVIHYGWVNYVLGVLWSLSVEEVFYLVFPILCFFLKKRRYIVILLIFTTLYAIYYRSNFYLNANEAYLYHYFSSFDAIAIGCFLGLFFDRRKYSYLFYNLRYLIILLMIFLYCYAPIKLVSTWSMTVFAVLTALLIYAYQNKVSEEKIFFPFIWLGHRSYEIYLFHLVILGLVKMNYIPSTTNDLTKWFICIIYLGLSMMLGSLIEKYYSRPMNKKIRSKFIKLG
ncbi:acyltransferase family protein [Acinetobacter nectaris]|uniref:acyltransferase family protein n=1 Tax=Acinetobacter nectaris TaxID=1219382 RepID=UPI001F308A45|nr:acyltransferase [Acinetobacter nectaris]MCF9034935.1 acyltransferase [Acinetobacter nectaris]